VTCSLFLCLDILLHPILPLCSKFSSVHSNPTSGRFFNPFDLKLLNIFGLLLDHISTMPTQRVASYSNRSKAQKNQLAAAHANRGLERSSSLSVPALQNALAIQTMHLRETEITLDDTRETLEETQLGLELEREHSASLSKSLCVVRRKQQRTYTAKVGALEKAVENMTLVDQLTAENETLEKRTRAVAELFIFSGAATRG
jgi:hypothetical protein